MSETKAKWELKVIYPSERMLIYSNHPVASADAGKREARECANRRRQKGLKFEIYDPQGSLYQYTEFDGSWRLRWLWAK